MANRNVNLKKIDRMGVLSFKNALRLHEDSILLFKNGRFPSAYTMSVLSLEELGKYYLLEDFVFHSRTDGRLTPKMEEQVIYKIYKHRLKQNMFAYQSDMPTFAKRAIKDIYKGLLEKKKQDSMYVGLPRRGRHINMKGRISSPFGISKQNVQKQITLVNDFIVCLAVGVLKGCYTVDIWELEELLTHDLVSRLRKIWPQMSALGKRDFRSLMRLPDVGRED